MKMVKYAIVIVCLLSLAGLVAVEETSAYFSGDTEQSSGNVFQAAAPEQEPAPSSGGGGYPQLTASCEDGPLTLTIDRGTIARDKNGKRLTTFSVTEITSPPTPPEGSNIIGLAYDFSPTGATFNPSITLTWSYDPDNLPEGVAEKDLVLAYYIDGEWIELECVVDTESNTVTASVKHFTTFALLCTVPEVVTPPKAPAEVSEPPVVEPPEVIVPVPTPAPPVPPKPVEKPKLVPSAPEQAPAPTPTPVPPELFPWHWFWIGLVAFVIIALVLIQRHRRKR